MYKGPPPEISSEDFYETDRSSGFVRRFSIQTVSPLPIGWAEHVRAPSRRRKDPYGLAVACGRPRRAHHLVSSTATNAYGASTSCTSAT